MKFSFNIVHKIVIIGSLLLFIVGFQNCKNAKISEEKIDIVDYNYHIRPILSDRCFKCHGPDANKREANLRLDTEAGAYAALKDSPGKHTLVKGNPQMSELYQRITSKDPETVMPPPNSNLSLTQNEIELLGKWIKQGAKYKKHWSFIVPTKSKVPENGEDWVKNPIDNFVLQKMQNKGLSPSDEADKETLLKRVSFDLTGLPPSIALQDEFLKDDSPEAYNKIVAKLLSSKHYGERMALNWLDIARYADSHGYQDDGLRTMWPWRDWVIHAFNSNYSYRKFVTWQLAGDIMGQMMPNHPLKKEMTLATGFNRNHKITQEGGVIDEEYRIEYVTDRTNTFGKSFMALTFECAKCHDHKFDPISQKEYYGTFAFFNQVPEKGIFGTIDASYADPPNMKIENKDIKDIFNFINKKDTSQLNVMVMADDAKIRPTHLLNRGAYDAPGDIVENNLPSSIMPFGKLPKNRYGLSQWMFNQKNPITARVYVNRIWEQFFGRGIVKTTGDFGMQGELPSHPELLDWLAVDFIENGYNIKRLVYQIVCSATYKQASKVKNEHLNIDPENIFLARASRMRFPAEIVRDHVLASSELLNPEIGGPSVKTYQPKGLWEIASSGRGSLYRYYQDHGKDLYRRGMYVFIKRTVPPPSMILFDASNRDQCEVQRGRTNTPLQALAMLNDPHVLEASSYLASAAITNKLDTKLALEQAFRKINCRKPQGKEIDIILKYYEDEKVFFTKNPKKIDAIIKIGEYPKKEIKDKVSFAALMHAIQLIYNTEESIIRI